MSEHSIFTLARLAECGDPDSSDSPGARFLEYVQDRVNEAREYGELDQDRIHEIADGAPDVYTHKLWAEFVDLEAYNEDPTDLGCDGTNMTQAAAVCLYIIAERLANALIADLEDVTA